MLLSAALVGDHPEEHERADLPLLLQPFMVRQPLLEKDPEGLVHVGHPALAVLGRAWQQPDLSLVRVHLPPLEVQHLRGDPPAGQVGKAPPNQPVTVLETSDPSFWPSRNRFSKPPAFTCQLREVI